MRGVARDVRELARLLQESIVRMFGATCKHSSWSPKQPHGINQAEDLAESGQSQAVTLRRIMGVTAPLIVGFVIATLLGRGVLQVGGNFNPLLALLMEVLVGIVGGLLISSFGLALAVPAAWVVGIALAGLVRTGTLAQGDPRDVAALAPVVLTVLLMPTTVGAVIGAGLGNRLSRHR